MVWFDHRLRFGVHSTTIIIYFFFVDLSILHPAPLIPAHCSDTNEFSRANIFGFTCWQCDSILSLPLHHLTTNTLFEYKLIKPRALSPLQYAPIAPMFFFSSPFKWHNFQFQHWISKPHTFGRLTKCYCVTEFCNFQILPFANRFSLIKCSILLLAYKSLFNKIFVFILLTQ